MTLNKAAKKSNWKKIYSRNIVGWARPDTFEDVARSVGQLLDETQLEMVDDWRYVKIEMWQHNDRLITVRVKCADHG
jgi:hypothetical protein